MEDPVTRLFSEWHALGGAVLLAQAAPRAATRRPEEVIAESTRYCRDSGRLTWVLLDWLIRHIETLDPEELVSKTHDRGDLSVLGVLCDAAYAKNPHRAFRRIMERCVRKPSVEIFFNRVARSPLASRLTREHPQEVFRRWNYVCGELNYL